MAPTNNKKPPGRQTNNSLSSLTEQDIVIGPPTAPPPETNSSPRKKKTKPAEVFTETEEVLQIGMHKVLEYVKNHDDAWPFMDPVEEDIAPRYYSIIRRPMDLQRMEDKLDNGEYGTFAEFKNDFKLIVNNCRLYNGQNNEYTEMVNNLLIAFEKATKKYFDQNSSDEETSFDYLDIKYDKFSEKVLSEKIKSKKLFERDSERDEADADADDMSSVDVKKRRSSLERKDAKKLKSKDDKNQEKSKDVKDKIQEIQNNKDKESKSSKSNKDKENSVKKEKVKQDYEKVSESLKKKDKKKIIKEIKKKHKGKIKGKIKDKRGRPTSSTKHKIVDKKEKSRTDSWSDIESGSDVDVSSLQLSCSPPPPPPPPPPTTRPSVSALENNKSKDKKHKKEKEREKVNERGKENHKSKKDKKSMKNIEKHKKHHNNSNSSAKGIKPLDSSLDDSFIDSRSPSPLPPPPTKSSKSKKQQQAREKTPLSDNELLSDLDRDISSALSTKDIKKVTPSKKIKIEEKKDRDKGKSLDAIEKRKPGRPKKADELEPPEPDVELVKDKKKKKDKHKKEKGKGEKKKKKKIDEPFFSDGTDLDEPLEPALFDRPITPDIIDKYDLVKQRRRQKVGEDKSVTPAKSEPPSAPTTPAKVKKKKEKEEKKKKKDGTKSKEKDKSKNHTLKETIEKLKKKSKKNKEDSQLLDEIFGVKPTKQLKANDEKTIYKKLRETYGGEKTPSSSSNKPHVSAAAKQPKNISEYDFIDDLAPTLLPERNTLNSPARSSIGSPMRSPIHTSPVMRSPIQTTAIRSPMRSPMRSPERKATNQIRSPAKKEKKAPSQKKPPDIKTAAKKQEKANMEALELETEQTLKDINKWLELTPHMSEFGSASSSPSRYIIDDLDTIPAARPDDFIRSTAIQDQENRKDMNSQFDALKEGKTDHNGVNKQAKVDASKTKPLTVHGAKDMKQPQQRKMTKLLNYVPPRKKEHLRTIDRLQPGKSKGNLINAMSGITKPGPPVVPLVPKVKEVKNSLIVEQSETGPKLSLGTVLDGEGFGLVAQHNFSDDKETKEGDEEEKTDEFEALKSPKPDDQATNKWGEFMKKDEKGKDSDAAKDSTDEEKPKKGDEPKINVSAWFKAFGGPKKPQQTPQTPKDDGESLSQVLGVDNNASQPTMRQRKSSTGSTTSELSSVSQDPDSPRITIDESYTSSYRSPVQLPIVTSPKPGDDFMPRQGASSYEINGQIKVGFYQDTTKCSPEKSPQESTPQYSMAHRTPPNTTPTQSLRDSFSYYDQPKPPTISASMYVNQYKKPDETTAYDSSSSPNPNSPYQNQPMSPYTRDPSSPYSSQPQSLQQQPTSMQHQQTSQQQQLVPPTQSQSQQQQQISAPKYTPPSTLNLPAPISNQDQRQLKSPVSEPSPKPTSQISDYSTSQPVHKQSQQSTIGQVEATQQSLATASLAPTTPWSSQGLYSTMDKNLFPLSLTNNQPQQHSQQSQVQQLQAPPSTQHQQSHQSNQLTPVSDMAPIYPTPPTYPSYDLQQAHQQPHVAHQQPHAHQQQPQAHAHQQQSHHHHHLQQQHKKDDMSMHHSSSLSQASNLSASMASTALPLLSKEQDQRKQQQQTQQAQSQQQQSSLESTASVYDKMPIDYASADRYKHLETYNRSFNKALSGSSSTSGAGSLSDPHMQSTSHQQNLYGPRSGYDKPQQQQQQKLDTPDINSYMNNYMQQTRSSASQVPPPTDYTMQNQPRYDLSRQTPAAHQQPAMDMNYKGPTDYMRNFASMMAEMGMAGQNAYSQSSQFVKNFHQATTAALQQFLPSSTMTTIASAYGGSSTSSGSKSARDDESRSQQAAKGYTNNSGSSTAPQYTNLNPVRDDRLSGASAAITSQQHMAAYQQKFNEAANLGTQSHQAATSQQHMDAVTTKQQKKSKSSSSKKKGHDASAAAAAAVASQMNQAQATVPPNTYPNMNQQHYPGSYPNPKSSVTSSPAAANDAALKAGVPPVPGSAFNFGPTPGIPGLPDPSLYPGAPNYLDDFRGTPNPYYLGHRNAPTDVGSDKNNPVASPVSNPYQQYLSLPSTRGGYPFMNPPPFDPLQQQWSLQRQEELRAQMMLASNPYSQSSYPRHLWG